MKKKFVRLISAVLSAAMTLTAVPLSAFARARHIRMTVRAMSSRHRLISEKRRRTKTVSAGAGIMTQRR